MPVWFNTLLGQAGIDPAKVRLLRHQDGRSDRGRSPYELWRDDRPSFEIYQGAQSVQNRTRLRADYWASFVVDTMGDSLLAGFYRSHYEGLNPVLRPWPHAPGADPAGTVDVYTLTPDDRLHDLSGRLTVGWGSGTRSWIQRADRQNKPVVELRDSFREPEFPGFTRFITFLSKVDALPASWVAALAASRGIYLLTCPRTREQYVGSATGSHGFYGRFQAYAQNGHGGNVGLKSADPADYQVSILEVAGSSATVDDILSLEMLWKSKLQSREMGLNRN